ncbi:hypothetical protein VINI7043_08225 [Vibrio nigripulchritudo ATCC 27043]|uniref:carbon-nitrogen hydrolase family protein n=1 Tax=Vibrio nigripulchritudo TaxID=28173 RepID=UPI00021C266C|nr:carbon-nitrogen hydrolase family protein [Vibrio nigripulchritudo]EGU58899.1 hypothetical protein VINI7043_08225 [Vibrio nigripulchritudo ATCC 27043]
MRCIVAQMWMQQDALSQIELVQNLVIQGAKEGYRIFVFPELAIPGFNRKVVDLTTPENCHKWEVLLSELAQKHQVHLFVGMPRIDGSDVYNSYFCFAPSGKKVCVWDKIGLTPSEQIFFTPGKSRPVMQIEGVTLSVVLCREVLDLKEVEAELSNSGVDLILWPSYIGYDTQKSTNGSEGPVYEREARAMAKRLGTIMIQCNWPNGTNVPDAKNMGGSKVISADGEEVYQALYDKPEVFAVHPTKTSEIAVEILSDFTY